MLPEWVPLSDGFYRSRDGRFDVMKARGNWYVIDGYLGQTFLGPLDACEAWVTKQILLAKESQS